MPRTYMAVLCLAAVAFIQAQAVAAVSRKATRSIDCRRLVFHPRCRGVAAKRALPNLLDAPAPDTARDSEGEAASASSRMRPATLRFALAQLRPYVADSDLAGILSRFGAEQDVQPLQDFQGPQAMQSHPRPSGSNLDTAWSYASPVRQAPKSDGQAYDWMLYQKRSKEPEFTYDY